MHARNPDNLPSGTAADHQRLHRCFHQCTFLTPQKPTHNRLGVFVYIEAKLDACIIGKSFSQVDHIERCYPTKSVDLVHVLVCSVQLM